jgi:sugar lactone lactonase YvrE
VRRAAPVAAALAAALVVLAAPAAQARDKYDVRVLAKVPAPGQPGLSLVAPDRTIYVSTFTNSAGTANGPSKVFAYTPAGTLTRTYTIQGQDPNADNGVQVAAIDANGLLYLLDQHPSRVLTLDPKSGAQSTYATFKDVPACSPPSGVGNECGATVLDNPPEPDYAAWGTDRSLYVTDYTQGLLWRVPPGGGAAHVWFTDERLDGLQFGPAGIVMMPDRKTLMISTSAGGPTSPNPTTGKLYTLPINHDGTPGSLKQLYESGPKEAPDGFALAKSGNVYLALVGPQTNQLVVVAPDGHEVARISHDGSGGADDVPFDEPSSVLFDGNRMIVTNDAYFSGDATHFAIFDVFAGEPGEPVYVPPPIQPATPVLMDATVSPHRVRAGRRVTLRLHVFPPGQPKRGVKGARAQVRGQKSRKTDKRGRTRLRVRFHRTGLRAVKFKKGGRTIARAYVRVVKP